MKTQKLLALSILLTAGSATSGWAATDTWTEGAGSSSWNAGGNWFSGSIPVAGDSLLFTGSPSGSPVTLNSVNNISSLAISLITFDSTAAAYVISESSGDTITTSGITDNSTNVETINGALALGGTSTQFNVVSGGDLLFEQKITGSKALVLNGAGTVAVSGNLGNTYTNGTTINSGTFLANNTSSSTGTGAVTVGGATLGGSGIIAPTVSGALIKINNGGTLAPGTAGSLNTLTIAGAGDQTAGLLTLASGTIGASLNFNLGAGNTSSLLSLTGTFAGEVAGLSGNTFNFTDLTSGHLSTGLYTLISTDTAASIFSGLTVGNLSGFTLDGLGGDTAQLQLNLVNGDETLQLDITNVAVVPEPGTWALLMGGVAILLIAQRRRFQLA